MASDLPSSNPFRRKEDSKTTAVPPASPADPSTRHIAYQQIDLPPGSSPPESVIAPKKIAKKVRVQSPPPPSPSVPDSASTIESLTWPTRSPIAKPREDPFDTATSEIREDEGISASSKAPANPFSRTLESMERSEREEPAGPPANIKSPGRASLDVDAFKRLLMTGSPDIGSSTTALAGQGQVAHQALADGGSSTDASSISRQSIFEAIQEAQAESPRTSHEISEPEEDRRRLATGLQRSTSGRKKPIPPSSRHGKVIKVELKDDPFTQSVKSPSTPGSVVSQNYFSASPHSPSDLNKPLPPAPRRASHDSENESVFDKEAAGKTPEPPSPSSSIRKKTPPAPPLSRRHSHKLSEVILTRSDFGRSAPKFDDDNISISTTGSGRPRSNSGKAPPPPPARRPAVSRGSSQNIPLSSPAAISQPVPPPARGLSRHSMSGGRPSSIISLETPTSSKRPSAIPPPPPPPRFGIGRTTESPGASRRASGEQPRPSMDSVYRGPGAISLSQNQGGEAQPGAQDILADLSALQREIDAARGQSHDRSIT